MHHSQESSLIFATKQIQFCRCELCVSKRGQFQNLSIIVQQYRPQHVQVRYLRQRLYLSDELIFWRYILLQISLLQN